MRKVTIGGREYVLRFDMGAMEEMEERIGSLATIFNDIRDGKSSIKSTRVLFECMAKSGAEYTKAPAVEPDAAKHITLKQMAMLKDAIQKTMADGMRTELDDDVRRPDEDIDLAEIEAEKN